MIYEWGDASAPPILLAHGAYDFARTFDTFAPLLARNGYRVVSWDQRGHGDSEHADLYSWNADERDLLAVADSISNAPIPAIGHSKGGSLLARLIQALPSRFSHFVAIDGLSFNRPGTDPWAIFGKSGISKWLNGRRSGVIANRARTYSELVEQRRLANPRLSLEWIYYLVALGAREENGSWRWKHDRKLGSGIYGPHPSQWMLPRLATFPIPLLAFFGSIKEPVSWDITHADLKKYLPPTAQVLGMEETGHFVHIERPEICARRILEFLRT